MNCRRCTYLGAYGFSCAVTGKMIFIAKRNGNSKLSLYRIKSRFGKAFIQHLAMVYKMIFLKQALRNF